MPDLFDESEIDEIADELRSAIGERGSVTATRIDPRNRQIVATSARVRMVWHARYAGRGGWRQAWSTLHIDGAQVPNAKGPTNLGEIFADPDRWPPNALPLPEGLPGGVVRALTEVHRAASVMAGQGGRRVNVGVERQVGGLMVVYRFASDKGFSELGVPFARAGSRWRMSKRGMRVLIDGEDRTVAAKGSIEKALSMLARAVRAEVPVSAGEAVGSLRSNAVETRRATVIRT